MMNRFTLIVCIFLYGITSLYAQNFDDYFVDKTLRLDYIFAGNSEKQYVFLNDLVELNQWNGRKSNLNNTPIQGNGQIKVYDKESQKLIYVLPFGSLFQEWLTLDEAHTASKSFENSFLIPFPKNNIDIQVSFFDASHNENILLTHTVNPSDILIRKTTTDHVTPYEIIHKASVKNPIKIAIVAEGFQEKELSTFMNYARQTVESLFRHDIFNKYQDYFEIVAVKTISKDSNVSVPSQNIWRNTAIQSHFDTFYSERYLTTSRVKSLHEQLENIPYQHLIILANTDVYGGGGILNSYTLTTTQHPQFAPVVVHEFGHSFAGLADEYFYEEDVFENKAVQQTEPWEQNITSLVDFASKWQDLVGKNTPIPTPDSVMDSVNIGAFEGLKGNGLYIPSHHCRMKTNQAEDFCQVCNRAIEKMILFYTENTTE